ncbi:sensor histidine kinase [Algoriphagus namhaensis]|uniref:histidine kinase n=1 Tax=Algoriphagus namhaensis TaxID=915353 RepID=A0ABV8ASC7_9BACT
MKKLSGLFTFLIILAQPLLAQEEVVTLDDGMFRSHQRIFLAPLGGWLFKQGHDPKWADPEFNVSTWEKMNPTAMSPAMEDENGRIEGWFRIKIRLDDSLKDLPMYLNRNLWAATDIFLDGQLIHSFGDTGDPYKAFNPVLKYPQPIDIDLGREYVLAVHFVDYESTFTQREIRLKPENLESFLNLTGPAFVQWVERDHKQTHIYVTLSIGVSFLLFFLYWFLVYLNPDQKIFRIIAWYTTAVLIGTLVIFGHTLFEMSYTLEKVRFILFVTFQAIMTLFGLLILEWVLTQKISKTSWVLLPVIFIANIPAHIFSISPPFAIAFSYMLFHFGRKLYVHRNDITGANWAIVGAVVVPTAAIIIQIILHKYSLDLYNEYDKLLLSMNILSAPLFYLAYISIRFKETQEAVRIENLKLLQVTEEKREILENQNTLLEAQVEARTHELNQSLENLKSAQAQLIQSEKMASLGELTAGIAHEIQNPLNFVNNFSELSNELIDEVEEERAKNQESRDETLVTEILGDIKQNLSKINLHGKRADAIVKGMLEHSRTNKGDKALTDLNALADEFVRLSYHGLRAKDKEFNADFKLDLDPDLPKVNVVASDIGRVILNLVNNAFYAVNEKIKSAPEGYNPEMVISSKQTEKGIELSVEDNGDGIPEHIKEKIFQPFFTTKPTGSGTGLGLSLSYDIVKAHGGELRLTSHENQGSKFTIHLKT